MNIRRAIILFVRGEREEAVAKPLPQRYRALGYSLVNQQIIQQLRPAFVDGVDLVIARGDYRGDYADGIVGQRGATFGERLANAILDVGAAGYQQLVVIGNDCPTITASDIATAFELLSSGATVVAAPTHDGGAFLIGACTDRFDVDTFVALPWCTSGLFASFMLLPQSAAVPVVRNDFDQWIGSTAYTALGRLLCHFPTLPAPHLRRAPLPTRSTFKARTRSFLPAPPFVG